jgi:Holliday junction resolvase RusA-like endonuclease
MADIVLTLSMPPTSNNLFVGTGRRRVKSAGYCAWETRAGWELLRQRPPRIKGPVAVIIEVSTAESTDTWDLCNREKATMDLLVTHGVIQGDNRPFVREFGMRWSSDIRGVRVILRPLLTVGDVLRGAGELTLNDVLTAAAERAEAAK